MLLLVLLIVVVLECYDLAWCWCCNRSVICETDSCNVDARTCNGFFVNATRAWQELFKVAMTGMAESLAARLSLIDANIWKIEQGVLNQNGVATVAKEFCTRLEVTKSASSRLHARKDRRHKAKHKYEYTRSQLITLMPRSVDSMVNKSANIKHNFAALGERCCHVNPVVPSLAELIADRSVCESTASSIQSPVIPSEIRSRQYDAVLVLQRWWKRHLCWRHRNSLPSFCCASCWCALSVGTSVALTRHVRYVANFFSCRQENLKQACSEQCKRTVIHCNNHRIAVSKQIRWHISSGLEIPPCAFFLYVAAWKKQGLKLEELQARQRERLPLPINYEDAASEMK